mgnify:CR=1 FL=1
MSRRPIKTYMRKKTRFRPYTSTSAARYAAKSVPMQIATAARRPELNGMDTLLDQTDIVATTSTNDSAVVLNLIQRGNGDWNRSGNQARLMSVRLTGIAKWNIVDAATTGVIQASTLRMVVVWDKSPNSGSIPTFATIFGATSQAGTKTTTFNDGLKFDNTGRFSVLRDMRIDGNANFYNGANGNADLQQQNHSFDIYIKLNGRTTQFSGTADPLTLANISTGALYVYFRADSYTDTNNEWQITGGSKARLRFYA